MDGSIGLRLFASRSRITENDGRWPVMSYQCFFLVTNRLLRIVVRKGGSEHRLKGQPLCEANASVHWKFLLFKATRYDVAPAQASSGGGNEDLSGLRARR